MPETGFPRMSLLETVRKPGSAPIWSLKSPRKRVKKLYFAALGGQNGGSRGCSRPFSDSFSSSSVNSGDLQPGTLGEEHYCPRLGFAQVADGYVYVCNY